MKWLSAPKGDKKNHLERLLGHGTVMIFLDARKEEVSVPNQHKANPQLALNFDYAFQIPDFKISESRIEATLEFYPLYFFCIIPLDSVYGMRCDSLDEMILFPESVPPEMIVKSQEAPSPSSPLRAVSVPQKELKENPKEKTSDIKEKRRDHLRLIK